MNNYEKELEVAINIAKEAGPIMLKYFDEDQDIEVKEDKSFVTIADKLINTMVIERLMAAFPLDGIIGEEESNTEYGMGRKWFCDPIDGTAGYVWGIPTSMFSLALIVDGTPVVGVAYDPYLNKMYTAVKGGKSFCNGKEINVSNKTLEDGIVGVTGGVRRLAESVFYNRLRTETHTRLATFSGAVYKSCLVAKGKFVGYSESGINAHDVAAIHLIVENAGGKITSLDGSPLDYSKPFKGAVISNGIVHEKLVEYCK